ncbi:MAG: bacillithiol biosynthesis BshC [Saprospiraceae bacterium]|nr:bacillithiol biosynthesis BshC [Candidatus Brachybacter algidus]
MDFQKIAFDKVNQLSHFDQLYAADQQLFSSLLPYPATMEGIAASIEGRKNKDVNRELLVEILTDQYKTNVIDGRDELIKSLSDKNTFTIVTAHQPYLFGGPLYFILKILSTVKLAEQVKQHFRIIILFLFFT